MGLDIYHYKAVLVKPKNLNPFSDCFITESDFTDFDVDMHYFNDYIQLIDTPKIIKTFIFAKNEHELDEVKAFLNYEYEFFYEKNLLDIEKSVKILLDQNDLSNCLLHRWETSKWVGIHAFTMEKQIGFYYKEVGYQRKGMNKHFFNRFCSNSIYCYTQKLEFEFALSCVDFYWDEDTKEEIIRRKQQFQIDFVDNYEYGRSWMNVSY